MKEMVERITYIPEPGKPNLSKRRRRKLPEGECRFCDDHLHGSVISIAPSHDASELCESGKHPHCTCDICF